MSAPATAMTMLKMRPMATTGRPRARTSGQYDGDGMCMCASAWRFLVGEDLLGRGDLGELAGLLVLLVLAVEELVDRVDGRDGVEVVVLRRAGGHPLQGAGVPRVERGVARARGWCARR